MTKKELKIKIYQEPEINLKGEVGIDRLYRGVFKEYY
jgi:hypothetical protein